MQSLQMNENQWKIAHDLASELHNSGTDVNEFGKVVAFMRRYQKTDITIDTFRLLLQRLANSGNAFSQSNVTPQYLENIRNYCNKHLADISDVDELMLILGWCRRLMYYYKEEPKRATEEQRPKEQKQTQKQPTMQSSFLKKEEEKPKIKKGDRVNATILKKEGFKVTVQLETDNNEEIVFERPYYPGLVDAKVKLRVMAVNENGHVTKVIP